MRGPNGEELPLWPSYEPGSKTYMVFADRPRLRKLTVLFNGRD